MKYKKQRGQERKLKSLIKNIQDIVPFEDTSLPFEHFHVPCGPFISSPKTSSKIKTAFCKAWIKKTESIIKQKPSDLPFCKAVALIDSTELWDSQIIIFYSEDHYRSFWDRNTPEQLWTLIDNTEKSFAKEHNIKTELNEICYSETITEDDLNKTSTLWFYEEI